MQFRHEVIDADPPGGQHDVTLLTDLTGNGRPDIIIAGKAGPVTVFWYENPGWARHDIAEVENLEAGGVLVDITGNGRKDIVIGQQLGGWDIFWFEQPDDPRGPWTPRVLDSRFHKHHDQVAADIDGDGREEILCSSQASGVIMYYDIPDDPRVSPWPVECCHIVAEDTPDIEGLAVTDIDGDGQREILAGPTIYKPQGQSWRAVRTLAPDYVKTRLAVADFTGDGKPEIVLCEGESHPGRLAMFSPDGSCLRVLRDDLFHPHSLEVADFDGDGKPDLFVAEMGLGKNPDPRMFIYRNLGGGEFEEHLIHTGTATHEAKVADLTGNGRPDIVGKAYDPEKHIDAWYNE